MARSLKKGYYIDPVLYDKVLAALETNNKRPIKTWARSSTIIPMMVGLSFLVHNGKDFIPVYIVENMVGCKLGEFSITRTFREHAGDRKAKKK